MNSYFLFILLALAVYRVAHMISIEDGPFDLFAKLRYRAGQTTWVGRGMHCPSCLSFWLSFAAALLLPWLGWLWYGVQALALSGVTVVLSKR